MMHGVANGVSVHRMAWRCMRMDMRMGAGRVAVNRAALGRSAGMRDMRGMRV